MRQQHLQTPEPASYTFASPSQTEDALNADASEAQAAQHTEAADTVIAESQDTSSAANIMALLQKEAVSRKKEVGITALYTLSSLLPVLYMTRVAMHDYATIQWQFLLWMLMSAGTVVGLVWAASRRSYRQKHFLARELEKSHDITTVGPLVDALKVENMSVRNLTKRALTHLLPKMQATDGGLLNDKQRDILLRQLAISPADKGYRDVRELFSRAAYQRELVLRLSILKALEQVGGAKELPAVERLSRGLPSLHSGTKVPKAVRQAAKECLPYLQSRAHGQRASEQLLRPSSADATTGDVLLRPASSHIEVLPEQMLRASEPGTA